VGQVCFDILIRGRKQAGEGKYVTLKSGAEKKDKALNK
jgi:hypothetical protein